MTETGFDRKRVIRYLIWTFALAYAVQFGAAWLYGHVSAFVGQLTVAAMMFVPALSVLLAGGSLRGMGWRPEIRRNIVPLLIAWLAPAVLTAAGAALYFLAFPGHLDLSGGPLVAAGAAEALAAAEEQGISVTLILLLGIIPVVTYAPLINMFLGLGEEIGWRGFLYPNLKARFGVIRGRLLGGVIWGAWHWPLIWLIGYEYGASAFNSVGYFGFPISGMLLFCVITTGWGVLHDWLYERSGSIWVPALFHGAINAVATYPLLLCMTDTGSERLLGPAPMGILAAVPFLVAAAILTARGGRRPLKKEERKD